MKKTARNSGQKSLKGGLKKVLEKDIQNAICEYLAYKGHFFWRQNTAPIFREGRFMSMPKFSINGVPDIIVIWQGNFIGIEVKRPGGKLSESQKEFQKRCLKAGGEYHVVTSLDQMKDLGL